MMSRSQNGHAIRSTNSKRTLSRKSSATPIQRIEYTIRYITSSLTSSIGFVPVRHLWPSLRACIVVVVFVSSEFMRPL